MKHVLYSCEVCPLTVLPKDMKGWWGATVPKPNNPAPSVMYAPLTKNNRDDFSAHFCCQDHLMSALTARASQVDMEKVAAVRKKSPTAPGVGWLDMFYGRYPNVSPHDDSSPHDGTGYYGTTKPEGEEEED